MNTSDLATLPLEELQSILETETTTCSAKKLHLSQIKTEIQQLCKENEIAENSDLNRLRKKIQAVSSKTNSMLSSARERERQIKAEMSAKVEQALRDTAAIHASIAWDNTLLLENLQARLDALHVDESRVEVTHAIPLAARLDKIPDGTSPDLIEELQKCQSERQRQMNSLAQLRQEVEHQRTACDVYIHRLAMLQIKLLSRQNEGDTERGKWEEEFGLPRRQRRFSSAH